MSGVGHVGELRIMEILKKRGMEIYLPLKDSGIDFIAVKSGKFYQIQVKTSMFQKNSYFWFDLLKNKMRYSENIFYVFVCFTLDRRQFLGKNENYLVIPSLVLKTWILDENIVSKKGDENCLNLFVYPDDEKKCWTYKNKGKKIDLTSYWNDLSHFA